MIDRFIAARMVVDYWKLLRAFDRLAGRLPNEHRSRADSQVQYSAARLDTLLHEAGMSVATFDGQSFTPNLPVAAVNAEDFAGEGELIVSSTLEPTIMLGMQILMIGKVIVARVEDGLASGN
jgi:hypothetical protein